MPYYGDIIAESLTNKGILEDVKVINTRVEPVTPRHKTPWLKQWTLHHIEVADDEAEGLAQVLSEVLDDHHWYIDYKSDTTHYIIFPHKIFAVNRGKPEEYKPVVDYGLSIRIPRHQLDFSPAIKEWERPKS